MQLLAVETVAGAEAIDLPLNAPLLRLEPRELGLPLGEGAQVLGDKRADGAALLRRTNPRGAVDVVGNGNGDVRHCEAQYHRYTMIRPDENEIVVRDVLNCQSWRFTVRAISGNQVRIPDPKAGEVAVISRYGKERAILVHPADFDRLEHLDRLLSEVALLEPMVISSEAVRAHHEEDTPGEPITDPALLAEIFG